MPGNYKVNNQIGLKLLDHVSGSLEVTLFLFLTQVKVKPEVFLNRTPGICLHLII